MTAFAYHRPESVDALWRVLAETPGRVELLAGGTDVLVGIGKGRSEAAALVDLKHLDVLRHDIAELDRRLRIGALCVLGDLIEDARVRRSFPALVEAASVIGSVQIRNRATLAGNVCNASPAADTVPALLIYGARVNVLGEAGEREVPLEDFFTGPRETVLGRGELVTSIDLPLPAGPRGSAFLRIARRRGFDLGTVSVACLVAPGEPARFGFGAVADRPLLAVDESGDPDELVARANPISDVRGSREYRLAMLATLVRRARATATARLREEAA